MDDPTPIISDIVGEVAAKTLDAEPMRNLLSPVTNELGLMLGDIGNVVRFYANENLRKIFKKWAEMRDKAPLNPEDVMRVLPLLQSASMQCDEELQERWAALLENTVSDNGGVLPSFGQALMQISSEEARYLDRLWNFASTPLPYLSERRTGRETFEWFKLIEAYDPDLYAPSPAEQTLYKDRMSPEQLAAYDKMTKVELMIQDFERLGIIARESELEPPTRIPYAFESEVVSLPVGGPTLKTKFSLTQYGISFMGAVTPRKTSQT